MSAPLGPAPRPSDCRGKMSALPVLFLVWLAPSCSPAASRPTYLITTPMDIRPGLNITLGISLLASSYPEVRVTAEVIAKNNTVLRGEGLFKTGSSGVLILPALPMNSNPDGYTLLVNGHAEDQIIFTNSTSLEFQQKGCFVFIQTDKTLYKPGQEVKIRVVTTFLNLKPYTASLDLHIRDPRGNLIEQWLEEEGDVGVVSLNFQLSSHPPLGDWSIQVQVNKRTHFQTFTVMEYVLPKFDVLLEIPTHHSMNKNELTGTITAKYTYGKPVKGKAIVTLSPMSSEKMKMQIKKTYTINGSVKFTFDPLQLKELITSYKERFGRNDASLSLDILAVVTESLTGISHNTSNQILFTKQEYVMEFSDYPTVLKPTLNFTAKLKVRRLDDNVLTTQERRNAVNVSIVQSVSYFYSSDSHEYESAHFPSASYSIPEDGVILIEVPLQRDIRHLQITATFLGNVQHLNIRDVFSSQNMTYIQIEKEMNELKVGLPFELTVRSNKPLMEIDYQVVSRRQIVAVGKKNSSDFTMTPESSWTPVALIMVYYIEENGEVVNDVLSLPVQPVFENKISLSWSKAVARPSEEVSLTMIAQEPNSLIGLLVADKSVKLLGDRNDITANKVTQELNDFSDHFQGVIINSLAVFEKCHLQVLTDARLVTEDSWEDLFSYDEMIPRTNPEIRYYDAENEIPPLGEHPGPSASNVRVFFPETWLWMQSKTGPQAHSSLLVTVPDTITTWVANAFVISEKLGLGMAAAPAQLQAFQPFFVSLNLPYSVTRGEQFILEVTIFNYLEETSEVAVILVPSDAFDFILVSNEINATTNRRVVSVPRHDGRTVMFPLKTNQLGEIDITIKATSLAASDAITQKVLVKAEGIEQSFSQSILLDLTGSSRTPITERLHFTFPSNVVRGSENAYIAVVGDILGPSINGLESLIQMPYGCGEQNMINFAPNIYILDYLTKTKQLTHNTEQKSIFLMKEGYQRELLFQRDDGSFSAFGASDASGSTWLSAFVLRCFLQARAFINIDPSVLQKTITWIFRFQKWNGEFWEPGRLLNSEMKGGNKSPVTLTAYIALAIAEYPGHEESSQFRSAINYLEGKMNEGITDNYTLAIVTYALSLADIPKAKEGLDILNRRAEQKGGQRFWRSSSSKLSEGWQPSSVDIEVAAYVLLSHTHQKRVAEGLPIMRWLSQQRNHLGGFSSTQDTILALQALSTISSLATVGRTAISVHVNGSNLNNSLGFKMDDLNRFLFQTEKISVEQPLEMNVSADGVGFAMFQLNIFYNVKEEVITTRRKPEDSQDAFDLDVTVQDDENDINQMTLNVCTRFLGTDTSSESGMVLVRVNLLGGFAPSLDSAPSNRLIKKVENGNGNVNLYFDSLNETRVCVAVPSVRDSKVAYTQDASVSVVDYYEPRRRAVRSYNSEVMKNLSPCAFCKKDCDFCASVSTRLMHSPGLVLFLLLCIRFIL
ncbi:CD109 antigen-like [Ambystoma mexicanum]|uniref:CD109 antigen-like n=1 Tax=Ambystoma mexicanum TaxID=8296 RepID=UPI0037E7C64D